MKKMSMIAAVLFIATSAMAQHSHNARGPNGGTVEDVAGVHAELVTAGASLTFYILDEDNKPIGAKGYSGSALVVSGGERQVVTLASSGDNALKGEAGKAIAAASAITLMLKTPKGKSGQARYKN